MEMSVGMNEEGRWEGRREKVRLREGDGAEDMERGRKKEGGNE